MIDQQERYYNILKLNKWFAISSILFVGIWFLVFADDYERSWKKYQHEFRQLEIEKTRNDIELAVTALESNPDYESLMEDVEKAQLEVEARREAIETIQERIIELEAISHGINQEYQFAKANLDVAKYDYEEAQHGRGDLELAAAEFYELSDLTSRLKVESGIENGKLKAAENELSNIHGALKKYRNSLGSLSRNKDLLKRKLVKTDPSVMSFSNKIANIIRDLPVLDFIDPYYEVKQVVVSDLEEDLIFLGVPRVDRCTTCHMGIDTKGYEDAPQPYTTHPKMDLYLGPYSPHPIIEYGCTACHGGRGRGTDFISAAHSPNSTEDRHRWEEELGWEPLHHWGNPMLPMKYVEASCYKCHSGHMPVKGAPQLSLGLAIVEKGGCFGCHQIERWEDTPKPGPGLRKIASKTTKDFAYKWINEPRLFRPDTWMPHFFKQLNTNDEESVKRTNQEIHAIVHFLFNQSEPYQMKEIHGKGDVENGRLLVASLGCLGCHLVEPEHNPDPDPSFNDMRREQGPNLIYLGSKTPQSWIYNWIIDPQAYYPSTKMPDLRLNQQEAADISAYLVSNVNEEFDRQTIPAVDENELDQVVVSFLEQTLRKEEVDSRLVVMNLDQKLSFAGEKLVRHYGCFSCHDIGGFEDAKPIGTPLTFEGSKLISKLDFGYLHDEIPHTKWDWFHLKLDNPRIYDMIPQGDGQYEMKVKKPLEKSRMPHFELNEKKLEAIVTVLMGFVEDEIPPSKLPARTTRNLIVEEGERLVQTYNCKGCHVIDGDGWAILPTVVDWIGEVAGSAAAEDASLVQSFAPPSLDSEGRKIQPHWLFNFFKDPVMIRPNLQVRMPSYSMISNDDWNKLIKYFQYKDNQMLAYENPHKVNTRTSAYKAGEVIQELGACQNCHFYGSKKPLQAALTWAPNLALTKDRLRPDWVVDLLRDPQSIMPGTKMPAPYLPVDEPLENVRVDWGNDVAALHADGEKMLEALRDYIWSIEGPSDVSQIVKAHLASEGYGFIVEDEEDDWGDEDW